MNTKSLYNLYKKSKKVTTDSRLVEEGALFFALKGDNFNGNKFAKKAIENGCSAAIIDEKEYAKDERFIVVSDALKALQNLANYHRKQLGIPILAITGSNGKTTTKELIASVLAKKYRVSSTIGNLNNHIGVPLTILSMDKSTEIGVVEMGANHMKEIEELCIIAEPGFGIITNIGKAHLEGFGSFENIVKAKKELYDYLKFKNGKVFFNAANEILEKGVNELKLNAMPFGSENSKVQGDVLNKGEFLALKLAVGDFSEEVNTRLVGNYNLENILAAVTIGDYFKVQLREIIDAIEEYVPKNNRSQFLKTERNEIYLDAYNANPSSVELSVKNFAALNKENAYVILGDMLELGDEAENEHYGIVNLVKSLNFKQVILVGEVFKSLNVPNEFLKFGSVNNLKDWLLQNNISNSNVLIKGSRGIQLETVVEYL